MKLYGGRCHESHSVACIGVSGVMRCTNGEERQEVSSEARKATMRAYSNKRYIRMRAKLGRSVGDGYYARRAPYMTTAYDMRGHVNRIKIEIGECVDCGLICDELTVVAFAFDHLDPTIKTAAISKMVNRPKKYTVAVIEAEIAKCELVCHCCHAFRTYFGGHHLDQNIRPAARQVEQLTLFTTG